MASLAAVLELGERSVTIEFADIRQYREAVASCRAVGGTIQLATPRIQKPGELGVFGLLAKQQPDGILARNWAGVTFFRDQGLPVVAGTGGAHARVELGQLGGRLQHHFTYGKNDGTPERAMVQWVVQAWAGREVTVRVSHERAGTATTTIKL